MNQVLNINQCASLIAAVGQQVTVLIQGHSGSGKSSIVSAVGQSFPAHRQMVIDCTLLDVGDVQIPAVDHDSKTSTFYPNDIFGTDSNQPVIVMLDEFGKASRPVQNALLPLMLERRIGRYALPSGSIVFGTTNLGAEGVGDTMQMHARNRISVVEMRKPTSEEWLVWAGDNEVDAAVMAWAHETPQIFQSFGDVTAPSDNPYIFHPREQRKAFVTPRSLYLASEIVKKRDVIRDDFAVQMGIAGTLGIRAAADLMAFVVLADDLPRRQSIIDSPETARVPKSPAAMVMVAFNCVGAVEKSTLDNFLIYIQRLPTEIQAVFATQLVRNRSKQVFAAQNRRMAEFVSKNSWVIVG